MSFKLLAIRPLKDCNSELLKNLKENQIYQFYNDYQFCFKDKDENKEVIEIIKKEHSAPDNLFGENINVSAIVGKNGTGKSTLVELLTVCKFLLSCFLKDKDSLYTSAKLIITDHLNDEKINCEIYFEKNGIFYRLCIKNNNPDLINYSNKEIKNFSLKDFFYSIVINYSIYAFNSLEIGHYWVEGIFRKNDSYQIPIVINPKRESLVDGLSGVIDINNEKELLKQRLLFNYLKPVINNDREFRKIGDNLVAVKLQLKNKQSRDINLLESKQKTISYGYSEENEKKSFWDSTSSTKLVHFVRAERGYGDFGKWGNVFEIIEAIKKRYKLDFDIIPDSYKIKSYLAYKVINICDKYYDYISFKSQEKIEDDLLGPKDLINIEGFLNKIEKLDNRSHITNKLMQAINHVRFYNEVWKKYEGNERITLDDLSDDLKSLSEVHNIPLIELLPTTSIFDIDIILKNEYDETEVMLSGLSSGERQLIYSVSSLVYHINNLESVKSTTIIHKYDEVNIVLDEIELYFHPDFQRKFVNYILQAIKNLNSKLKFNILFITHSPFILSDIPKQNILYLKTEEKEVLKDGELKKIQVSIPQSISDKKSFGANIHDLLAESFFIGDGLIGDFAKEKINKTLNWIRKQAKQTEPNIEYDPNIKYNSIEDTNEYNKQIIELIDDPLVKYQLKELYFKYVKDDKYIEDEIKRLQQLMEKEGNVKY